MAAWRANMFWPTENPNLMFCERHSNFETYTRNYVDLSAIPIVKQESHCPIVMIRAGGGPGRPGQRHVKGAVAIGADALPLSTSQIQPKPGVMAPNKFHSKLRASDGTNSNHSSPRGTRVAGSLFTPWKNRKKKTGG